MFLEHKQLFHWRRRMRKGREIAYCRRMVAGIMLSTAATLVAEAAPSGGVVTSGTANVTLGTATTIDQTSARVDIDWTGFDTTASESVTFNQPDSRSLAVNRISGNRTQFDGTLNANGQVFLINQNGITFGSTAQVNAGSLLATTAAPVSSTAQPGSHTFLGTGYGTVVNNGEITVSDGGFAVLAAPYVENNGLVRADLGQVELASTNAYTVNVDLRGDGLITFSTAGERLDDATGPLGVTSAGTVQARSGHVYLGANTASQIVEGVINLSGVVDADQFVSTPGGTAMVAAAPGQPDYPGGTIKVESTGDINIGGGADIHAIGGETVTASFRADGDIAMGADGNPATITLKAQARDNAGSSGGAHATAGLEMVAAAHGGTGTLTIADGTIEVTADASGSQTLAPAAVTAAATAVLEGAAAEIHADFDVHARAETRDSGTDGQVTGTTEALAALDVIANGEIERDTSGNLLRYGARGDLTLTGDIAVDASATTVDSATVRSTANTLLAASGNATVTGDLDTGAVAVSAAGLYSAGSGGNDAADAGAALLITAGTPPGLLGLLRDVSLDRVGQLGSLSDSLTLANLDDVLAVFGGLVNDPLAFLDRLGGLGRGSVSYTGDSRVHARADYDAGSGGQGDTAGRSEATAAGYFVAGGDVFINTDPVRIDAQADANVDDPALSLQTEARSFLVAVAGLADLFGSQTGNGPYGTLTVLGDLSSRAREQASVNGAPDQGSYDQLAAAVTALLASGDITVRGADPLAGASPAAVQDRSSQWQLCYQDQCTPVTPGPDGVLGLAAASAGAGGQLDSAHLAQLVIESLHGDIDIQPKQLTDIQPAGLFTDPVGPLWPGDLPLRFAADGRMLAATGADATRPPQFVALDRGIEAAILAGADPTALLPPAASGGCIAAGRDAYTISGPDYFDRMIPRACEGED
jgi:filamentous hemagglutinin family protein